MKKNQMLENPSSNNLKKINITLPSEAGKVPASQTTGTTNGDIDGDNFVLVPDVPERLLGRVSSSGSDHFYDVYERERM